MEKNQNALIVFAREPKDGKVKTRLLTHLSPPRVTSLYKGFLETVFEVALKVPDVTPMIYYAGTGSAIPFLRKYENRFTLRRQTGSDLGARMHNAFSHAARQRYQKTVIIGTDCLTLSPTDIQKAFLKLNTHDCVLGPSKDGGYYLIGLKHPDQSLFSGIHWSTDQVLEETLKWLRRKKKKGYLLSQKEDIDTFRSLRRYAHRVRQQSPVNRPTFPYKEILSIAYP